MNTTGTIHSHTPWQDAGGNTATATRTVTVVGNRTVDLNATVAMDMIWCPAGTFTMGSPTTEQEEELMKLSIMSPSLRVLPRQIRGYAGTVRGGDDRSNRRSKCHAQQLARQPGPSG